MTVDQSGLSLPYVCRWDLPQQTPTTLLWYNTGRVMDGWLSEMCRLSDNVTLLTLTDKVWQRRLVSDRL